MANPNEVRPEEQATAAENTILELNNLTPHPEEFQSIAKEVISTMAAEEASSMESKSQPEAVEVVSPSSAVNQTTSPLPASTAIAIPETSQVNTRKATWQSRLGLKEKATLAALLLTVIPTIAIGSLTYNLSFNALKQEGNKSGLARAESLAAQTNSFMSERYNDIQVIAQLPFLTDFQVRETLPLAEQQATLEAYRATYGVYSSIAAFDLEGDVIAQSTFGKVLDNHLDRNYIQAVLTTGKPHISQPQISKTTGEVAVYFAAPILDNETGEMMGVVRSRMITEALSPLMDSFSQEGYTPHIADSNGVFIAASEAGSIGQSLEAKFQNLTPLLEAGDSGSVETVNATDNQKELVSYTPLPSSSNLPDLGWSATVSVDQEIIFASTKQLLIALLLGTTAIAGIVAFISVYLAGQATRPVIQAAEVVEKMGLGQLDARLDVPQNGDEIALLGSNINRMGGQLQNLLQSQESDARLAGLLTDIARLQSYDALEIPLANALKEIQQQMGSCRVAFARITDSNGSSKVIAEAVKPHLSQSQGESLSALSEVQLHHFRNEQKPRAYKHLSTADFTPELLSQLQAFQVQSMLYAPVLVNSELYGLLSLQVCDQARDWSLQEIERLAEFGNQLGLVINSVESFEQAKERSQLEREQKETIQRELITLLAEVEGASSGDLTVRAQITDGEIGIVADFFNAIVENLRDVVTQVKQTSSQVNNSVNNDGDSIRRLSTDSIEQATQINVTLASIEEMTNRLQTVAQQATEAAQAAQTAETTAKEGGQAMEDTVNSISEVRQTVADTAKQVKRLGESSQQISKVVELINQIALKTNLLAVNAGIEAARAGEEGRGFAVVAEEVGALAAQSAVATKEIEQIINSIQTGTSNVVEAMESSTSKVVEGTRSVEEAKKSLEQILEVSREVNGAFQLISNETTTQAYVAEQVKQMMAQVAQVSTETSNASREVSESLQATAEITEQLQISVGAFKVDTDS